MKGATRPLPWRERVAPELAQGPGEGDDPPTFVVIAGLDPFRDAAEERDATFPP
jgi:hypothetical protein